MQTVQRDVSTVFITVMTVPAALYISMTPLEPVWSMRTTAVTREPWRNERLQGTSGRRDIISIHRQDVSSVSWTVRMKRDAEENIRRPVFRMTQTETLPVSGPHRAMRYAGSMTCVTA